MIKKLIRIVGIIFAVVILIILLIFGVYYVFVPRQIDVGGYRDTNSDGKVDIHIDATQEIPSLWDQWTKKK